MYDLWGGFFAPKPRGWQLNPEPSGNDPIWRTHMFLSGLGKNHQLDFFFGGQFCGSCWIYYPTQNSSGIHPGGDDWILGAGWIQGNCKSLVCCNFNPPAKPTCQWKITIFIGDTSSNGCFFHCHVSFPGCGCPHYKPVFFLYLLDHHWLLWPPTKGIMKGRRLPGKPTPPLEINGWKMYFLLKWSLIRGHV